MWRVKDILNRNGGNRRRSPNEPMVIPYNPQANIQPQRELDPQPQEEPPMPLAPPPPVPMEEPVPILSDYHHTSDEKPELGATYSPSAISPSPFQTSPPSYVSHESTATPPYNMPYESSRGPPAASHFAHYAPQVHSHPAYTPPPVNAQPMYTSPPMHSQPMYTPPSQHASPAPIPTVQLHAYGPPPAHSAPPTPPSGSRRNSQPPAPGDLPIERAPGQKITPQELRELREMIRERYALDLVIWSERFLRPRDRDITQAKMRKADALLNKIRRTVITWNRPEYFEHGTGDFEAFQDIARRIHMEGKKDWANEPPWMPERRM